MENNNTTVGPDVLLCNLLYAPTQSGCQPEHIISLIAAILQRVHELGEDQLQCLRGEVLTHYDHITDYGHASSVPTVKTTAARCAYLTGHPDTYYDILLNLINNGEDATFFEEIDFLMHVGTLPEAQDFFREAWNAWYESRVKIEPIQDTQRGFITRASSRAFDLGLDELGLNIASLLDPELTLDNPNIIIYRHVVRTPEEFDMAISAVTGYFHGIRPYIPRALMNSLKIYIESQIEHIRKHDAIEGTMLKHYELRANGERGAYNFHDKQGITYVSFTFYTILAVLFQDASQAEMILRLLGDDNSFTQFSSMIDEVVYDLQLGLNLGDDEVGKQSLENNLKDSLLVPILKMYAGVEYIEIQNMVYSILKRMYGSMVRESMDEFSSHTAHARMRIGEIAHAYLVITDMVQQESSAIRSMYIQMRAFQGENGQQWMAQSCGEIALYVMWFFLYYGRYPTLNPEAIQQIRGQQKGPAIDFLKQIYISS